MRRFALLLACPLLALPLVGTLAAGPAQVLEDEEPPLLFSVECEGKEVLAQLDRPFRVPTQAGETVMTIHMKPHRVFRYAGVLFHYPNRFAFRADLSGDGCSKWTLSGELMTITVFRYEAQEKHEFVRTALADAIVRRFGKESVTRKASALQDGLERIDGEELEVRSEGRVTTHFFYSFRSGKDSILLSLQDTRRQGAERGREAAGMEEMFRGSFRRTRK